MKATTTLTAVMLVALNAGCLPEKRIVWSPDGERAAIAAPNGLFLIDAQGKVLKPRLTGTAVRCNWFPDSRRLAVVHESKVETWRDVTDMFNAVQTGKIKELANTLRQRVLAYEGDWDQFELDPDDNTPTAIEIGMLLYLRDHLADGLPEKLGDKWEDVENLHPDIHQLQLFTVTQEKLKPGKMLVRSFCEIYQPKVAPNGRHVAFLMPLFDGTDDDPALHVVSCESGDPRPVAENVGLDHDWSPDGRRLVFIQSSAQNFENTHGVQLGSLVTIGIAKENGSLLPAWEDQRDLVGLLFNPLLAVRWLSDDRLLFSSFEATLPTTTHDMPQQWSLFVFDPRMPASIHRVLGRDFSEPLEVSVPLFALSPDGKRVLLPGPNGQVVLHDFASSETKSLIEDVSAHDKRQSLPTWRNNVDVCLVRPSGDEQGEGEVVLWHEGQFKPLSNTWSEEMREGWLDDN